MENKKVESIETPFTVAILVFYIALIHKFADVCFDKKGADEHCSNLKPTYDLDYIWRKKEETEKIDENEKKKLDYKNCVKEKQKMKDDFENNKFLFLIVLSVLSMIISCYLLSGSSNKNYNSAFAGIIGGSLLTIIYQIFFYWSNLHDNLKLAIYSASFVLLVVVSGKYIGI